MPKSNATIYADGENIAILDIGTIVNSKMKSLAATTASGQDKSISYSTNDDCMKALDVHLNTPAPFVLLRLLRMLSLYLTLKDQSI